jgi:hypothetical protein
LKAGKQDGSGQWTCRAFPAGIHYVVLVREEDHTKPLPYDNGFQYQPTVELDPEGRSWAPDWAGNLQEVKA